MCSRPASIGSALIVMLAGSVHAQSVLHVDTDSPNNGPGADWEHAYHCLQDALSAADVGDEIRVAEGTYRPDETTADPTGTGDREATFQLMSGVTLQGGYAGYGATDPNEHDISSHQTILSGDLDENDNPADFPGGSSYGDNSYHVVTGSGADATSVLDGFTVTAGNADGASPHDAGGGMYNNAGRPTLANCTFLGNAAVGDSVSYGGGMYNYSSSLVAINCRFIGNSAASWNAKGAGMCNWYSDPVLVNCLFSGNATSDGATDGGAMFNYYSDPSLINSTLVGNSSDGRSGGIANNGANPVLANCILWGNRIRSTTGVQISDSTTSNSTVTFSCVQNGASESWFGTGCIATDPLLTDADGPDDVSGTADDDVHLLPGSPCIDAGDNSAAPLDVFDLDGDGDTAEPLPFDLDGNPRFVDVPCSPDTGNGTPPIVDMGAYEHQPEIRGDCDGSEQLDLDDFSWMADCFAGPSIDPGDECACADMSCDGDVDLADFAEFSLSMTTP